MSLTNLPIKIAGVLSSFTVVAMRLVGYEAGMPFTDITPAFIVRYMFLLGGVPALFYIAAALVFAFGYKISDEDAVRYALENWTKAAPH